MSGRVASLVFGEQVIGSYLVWVFFSSLSGFSFKFLLSDWASFSSVTVSELWDLWHRFSRLIFERTLIQAREGDQVDSAISSDAIDLY